MKNSLISRDIVALSFFILIFTLPTTAGTPGGHETYTGLQDQFTVSLPSGWTVFNQMEALTGNPGTTGPVMFCSEQMDTQAMMSAEEGAVEKLMGQMASVEIGETPGFMLDRLPIKKGMSCAGFTPKAEKKILTLMGTDPMFGPERTTHEAPQAEPATIGGCKALRFKGKGETRSGDGKILDVFAVADDDVLYLFKLLNVEEHYPNNVQMFEDILSTLELAASASNDN